LLPRKTDGISIAGGEPLIYPHIVELVRYVAKQGWKPVIITNGTVLTPQLIQELQQAGLAAFTVHVDSHQHRPGWDGKSEQELNELRTNIAQMIHDAGRGRVAAAFNATIYPDTVKDVPAITQWAQQHINIVQTLVFILFRQAKASEDFDYYGGGQKLNIEDGEQLVYFYPMGLTDEYNDVNADEVAQKIKEACPLYEPCAFLNSNQDSSVPKWLLAERAGTSAKILGYMDGRFMEFNQVMHHLLFGTYLAYPHPSVTKNIQFVLPFAVVNRGLRKLLGRWLRSPGAWFRSLFLQSIVILQPPDVLEDGRQAMCDGCPDAIYHNGRLIWKCRLEEVQKFGDYVQAVRRSESEQPSNVSTSIQKS